MKKEVQILLACFLLSVLFTACKSMSYFGIETYTPAEVTFPGNVKAVVIADNALNQPSGFGKETDVADEKRNDNPVDTDSITYFAAQALAKTLYDSKFFDHVMLYKDPVRTQGPFYSDVKLLPEQVSLISGRTNADAVISIDRLLFNAEKELISLENNYELGGMIIRVSGVLRVYLPDKNEPLSTLYVSDSVKCWIGTGNVPGADGVNIFSDKDALRYAVMETLYRTRSRFIPYWTPEERCFYKQVGSRWIEASVYARNEKWDEAAGRWLNIFQSAGKNTTKAMAAYNMALYYELKGDFPEALDWAEKSLSLFEEHYKEKKQHANVKQAKSYVDILTKRIEIDKKINVQLGK